MNALITTLIEFIAIMLIGYIVRRTNILDQDSIGKMSRLIVKVTVPAMILSAACHFSGDVNIMYIAILVGMCIYAVLPFLAKLIAVVFRIPKAERGIYEFMMIFGNVGFMGMPLANAVFGSDAVLYVSVLQNLPFNLFMYTYGVYLFCKDDEQGAKISPKMLLQPAVLIIPISILVLVLNLKLPAPLVDVVDMVGDTTTPLSMMVTGAAFVGMPVKRLFNKPYVYLMTIFRLLLVPIVGYLTLKLCGVPQLLCNIFVASAGLPVASTTVIYSYNYGKSTELATAGVFITTALCVLTVPLAMLILGISI